MNDTPGQAGSEHYQFTTYDDPPRYTLAGVTLPAGAYELIEGQLHLMRHAADEGVVLRYFYQLEGVLLALLRYEDLSPAGAEDLRMYFRGKLPAALVALTSVP